MSKFKKTHKASSDTDMINPKTRNWRSHLYKVSILIFAILFGALNCFHQYTMFENDRHFSHLSTLEREMTFRTEMGLYYFFYKTLVGSESFYKGMNTLLSNNLTEFPKSINTLKRFNLYPEVILGATFRVFSYISTKFKWETKECYIVDRGEGFSNVVSCEGLGDPEYFYVMFVFAWNATLGALIFIYGCVLSDSIFGGIISAASFFYNHGECTRVQWTPPLRESFAFPFCLALMIRITITLRNRVTSDFEKYIIAILSAGFLLTWQFAQFALLTQTLCVYAVYILQLTTADTVRKILQGHMIGLVIAFVLLFGNALLFCSFYTSVLIFAYILLSCEHRLTSPYRIWRWITHSFLLCTGSFLLKNLVSAITGVEDDKHIWNLLKAKFTSYKDFHTLLYTCAIEFDFMEKETPIRLSQTLLLPTAVFVALVVTVKVLRRILKNETFQEPEIVYNLLQLLAYGVLAVLFMRLKLFFTPLLCIFVSLVASKQCWRQLVRSEIIYGLCTVLLAIMSVQGLKNIQHQRDILGEYSNPQLEDLILWANSSTPKTAVFAGPMPTMANLILSTNRPIVNHPHYEDADARTRNKNVYTIYSRKSAAEVHKVYADMGVQYAVLGKPWCFGTNKPGCSMLDLWDIEEPFNHHRLPLCRTLASNPEPFKKVFSNEHYIVLKVTKL